MKLDNQNNAALILLLHSFLIAIGMIVAYFIPSTEDPTSLVGIPVYNLRSQTHSDAELQSWLNFLESPHEETLIGKDTLTETLEKNETLGTLDFFSNVPASDRVDYLADRISISEIEDQPYRWKLTLQDASPEEAYTVLNALHVVQQRKMLDQVAAYDPPIDIPHLEFVSDDSISPDLDRSVQFGKACPPAVGALLAAILVVVSWSFCMPSQRQLPFASSISLLLASTMVLSFVGAGIGYLFTANSGGEWESEMAVQVRRMPFSTAGKLSPETQSLTDKLNQKLEVKNRLSRLNDKDLISRLIGEKAMTTWRSFKHIAKASGNETNDGAGENLDLLCDYISDRLEIEQDPDASEIYTLRFRGEDAEDSCSFLAYLVADYEAALDQLNESVGIGGQLTRKYQINRLSIPESNRVWWPRIASGNTFQGAFIGAIFTLVIISSTRVLAGAPPV